MVVPNILAGFDLDCNALFVKFEKLSTVRFSTFAEIWREMKFSLVFNGRRVKELICFTSEALSYTKYFFIHTNSFLRRVCALYIMYGIYYKQPMQGTSKILITMEEWKQVKDFVIILQNNEHVDTLFILLTLIFDNAFEFAITNSIIYTAIPCRGIIHTKYTVLDNMETLDLNTLTNSLRNAEQDYANVKKKLAESLNIPYMNYANDNFSQELKDLLSEKIDPTYEKTQTTKPGTSKQTNDNRTEKRRLLREKSFKKKCKSNLYRSSMVDNTDESDD